MKRKFFWIHDVFMTLFNLLMKFSDMECFYFYNSISHHCPKIKMDFMIKLHETNPYIFYRKAHKTVEVEDD